MNEMNILQKISRGRAPREKKKSFSFFFCLPGALLRSLFYRTFINSVGRDMEPLEWAELMNILQKDVRGGFKGIFEKWLFFNELGQWANFIKFINLERKICHG